MKKTIIAKLVMFSTLFAFLLATNSVTAQQKSHKKQKTIVTKASSVPSTDAAALKRPGNEKTKT